MRIVQNCNSTNHGRSEQSIRTVSSSAILNLGRRSRLQYHNNHRHQSLRRKPLFLLHLPYLVCILTTTGTTTFHRSRSSGVSGIRVEALASCVVRASTIDPTRGGTPETIPSSLSRTNYRHGYRIGSFLPSSTWVATGRMMASSTSTGPFQGTPTMTTTSLLGAAGTQTTVSGLDDDSNHHQQIADNETDNVMDRNTKEFHQLVASAVDLTSIRILSSSNTLSVIRSVRNWDTATRQSYLYRLPLQLPSSFTSIETTTAPSSSTSNDNIPPNTSMQLPPVLLDRSIQIYLPSPSGEKTLVVRTIEKDNGITGGASSSTSVTVMEIWMGASLVRRVPIQPDSHHGKVIDDPIGFGQPLWSPDEECILYSAERSASSKKTVPFWMTTTPITTTSSSSSVLRGGTNVVGDDGQQQEHWGERYSSQSPLHDIYILNTTTGKIGKVQNVPTSYYSRSSPEADNQDDVDAITNTDPKNDEQKRRRSVTLGQAVWHPSSHRIAYTVWDAGQPKRLGMVYCRNRVSSIYESDITSLMESLAKVNDDDDNDDVNVNTNNSSKDSSYRRISGEGDTILHYARSPRYVAGSILIFLASDQPFVSHDGCMGLFRWSEEEQAIETVVPIVDHPATTAIETSSSSTVATVFGMAFPGLFVSQLPSYLEIIEDNNSNYESSGSSNTNNNNHYIVTTTLWGSVQRIIRINIFTGGVDLLDIPTLRDVSSQSMVCMSSTNGDVVLAEDSNDRPTRLWIIPRDEILQDANGGTAGKITIKNVRRVANFPPVAATMFSPISSSSSSLSDPTMDFLPFDVHIISTIPSFIGDDEVVAGANNIPTPIQSILLLPKNVVPDHDNNNGDDDGDNNNKKKTENGVPLIVIPHGGPHSCSVSAYTPGVAYMATKYAILLPNYRGSTGFGHGPLTSLLSRIGTQDVQDIMACTMHVMEGMYPNKDIIDRNRIGICGGSHGGFLTAHCTAQYPDFFKAAAMRNPVTNIASMFGTTDIPDWTMGEVFGTDDSTTTPYDPNQFRSPTREQMMKLHEKSPISKIQTVKTPTLIALGMSDLRVPPSQGLEWYHNLRSMSVPTKLLTYPKDGHALDQVATEADHWLHIRDWFDRYL
jgi:acylaminoacyl-peptidase